MNHQRALPAEVDGRNEVSDNEALLRWLQLKDRNVHVAGAAFPIMAALLLLQWPHMFVLRSDTTSSSVLGTLIAP